MKETLGGLYHYDSVVRSLTQVVTGQSIRCLHVTAEGDFWFEYTDDETTLNFVVEKHAVNGTATVALMNFGRPESAPVVHSYGLWRRVTFFCWIVCRSGSFTLRHWASAFCVWKFWGRGSTRHGILQPEFGRRS